MKRKLFPILIGLAMLLVGCNQPAKPVELTSVTFANKSELEAKWTVGDADRVVSIATEPKLSAEELATKISEGEINVTSTNAKVVTATDLTLKAVDVGESTINLLYKDVIKDTFKVTISEKEMSFTKFEISNKDVLTGKWNVGDATRTIEVSTDPAINAAEALKNGNLTFTTSNDKVVTVMGKVATPVGEGEVTLSALWKGEVKDSVKLTISAKPSNKDKFGTVHEGTLEDPFDNEDALKAAKIAIEVEDKNPYYFKGIVESFYHAPGSRDDGCVSWFMKPAANGGESFEIYKCLKEDGSALTDDDIWKGAEVVAYGSFTVYGTQYETTTAVFVSSSGDKPNPKQDIPVDVAGAIAAGSALKDGDSTWDNYIVTGYVVLKSGSDFFLADSKDADVSDKKALFELYNVKAEDQANLTKGAKVSVKCSLKNYHGQIENNGAMEITLIEEGTPWDVKEIKTTVSGALEVINSLKDGATTPDFYVLENVYISEITDAYSAQYKNVSFIVKDTAEAEGGLKVFRLKFETQAESDAVVAVGKTISLKGNLQKYVKNDVVTPELVNPVLVAGTTPEPVGVFYTLVDSPVAGTSYKFALNRDDKYLLATGALDSYYAATTEDASASADFELVTVEGGFNVKVTLADATVKWLNLVVSGDYTNIKFEDTATSVWTIDAEHKTIVTVCNGHTTASKDGTFFLGTQKSKTYNTMSATVIENFDSNYIANFYTVSGEPVVPPTPTPDPVVGETLTCDFSDKANRTSFSVDSQVWTFGDVTFTNDKTSTSSNIADYAPIRVYQNSLLRISSSKKIASIVLTFTGGKNMSATQALVGGTLSVDGEVGTITCDEGGVLEVLFESLSGQVRISQAVITFVG